MRCQVCDWSSGTSSLYNDSIIYRQSQEKKVSYSQRYKKFLCTDCKSNQEGDTVDYSFVTFGDLVDEHESRS